MLFRSCMSKNLTHEAVESSQETASKSKYVPPHLRNRQGSSPSLSSYKGREERNVTRSSPRGLDSPDWGRSPSSSPRSPALRNSSDNVPSRWSTLDAEDNRARDWDKPSPKLEAQLFGTAVASSGGINFEKYAAMPIELTGNDLPNMKIETFEDADLGVILERNIKLAGFANPTPVQKNAFPVILNGRDLMACAQTGSGKTAAFLIPTLARIFDSFPEGRSPSAQNLRRRKALPIALILEPTRELAGQIHQEVCKFTYRSPCRSVVIYGGADIRNQIHELETSSCEILVATPGRLTDLLERGKIGLEECKFLILDEADRMLDMGFEPQIRTIVERSNLPGNDSRQTLMFSATFPKEIQRLAQDFLNDYVFLSVGRIGSTTDFITQKVRLVEDCDKKDTLVELLDSHPPGLTLVFVETKKTCDYIENFLCDLGYPAIGIHGDRSQYEREAALNSFRTEKTPILVATDVAARGLDIDNVLHVINYDLPNDINDYVHRIGRTGRAGNTGIATALINDKNINILRELLTLLEETKQEIPPWLQSMAKQSSYARKKSQNSRDFRSRKDFKSRDRKSVV